MRPSFLNKSIVDLSEHRMTPMTVTTPVWLPRSISVSNKCPHAKERDSKGKEPRTLSLSLSLSLNSRFDHRHESRLFGSLSPSHPLRQGALWVAVSVTTPGLGSDLQSIRGRLWQNYSPL